MSNPRQGPYAYSPIIDRPPLRWPQAKRVAVWVVPNIEFYPYNVDYHIGIPGVGAIQPNILEWSRRDYGNRVGVYRMMDVLGSRGIRATVALNSDICLEHPRIIERANALDWELMGHGETNARVLCQLTPDEERACIDRTLHVIEDVSGTRPVGWLGPGATETYHTLGFLNELGITYVADFMSDDQPFLLDVGAPRLVAVPYTTELNDTHQVNRRGLSGEAFADLIRRQFDQLYEESETTGGMVMAIALHPWITGVPHTAKPLGGALDHIAAHDGAWFATGREIADAYVEACG